jgi:hypothetical protein
MISALSFFWALLVQSRVESSFAEEKAPPLSSPQHGGARFADTRTAFFLAERYA